MELSPLSGKRRWGLESSTRHGKPVSECVSTSPSPPCCFSIRRDGSRRTMSWCFWKHPPSPHKCAILCHKFLKPEGLCGSLQNLRQENIFICTSFLFWSGRKTLCKPSFSLPFLCHAVILVVSNLKGWRIWFPGPHCSHLRPLVLNPSNPGLCSACSHGSNGSSRKPRISSWTLAEWLMFFSPRIDFPVWPAYLQLRIWLVLWLSIPGSHPLGPIAALSRPPDAIFAFSCLFLIKCSWHVFLPAGAQKFPRLTPRFCLSKNTLLIFRSCCLSRLLHLNVVTHTGQSPHCSGYNEENRFRLQ